jgi:protein-S-isoprenylcysteine O-methyltransferase Ste14
LIALFPILGSTGAKPLPAMVPALALIVLFFGSTLFTEKITQSKYPEAYRQYQKRVGMIFPIPWGWLLGERERASVDRAVWGGKEE